MHPILRKLEGGDRRSIGRADEVAAEVMASPDLFAVLVSGLESADALVRMRAADAMEKASAKRPDYLQRHKKFLIRQALESRQKEVRWHLAQMLPRLELTPSETQRVYRLLLDYCNDASSIVRTFAMQGLVDIAHGDSALRAEVTRHIEELTATGTPAMQARGAHLLAVLRAQRL